MIKIIHPDGSMRNCAYDRAPKTEYLAAMIGCQYIELVRVFYKGNYE